MENSNKSKKSKGTLLFVVFITIIMVGFIFSIYNIKGMVRTTSVAVSKAIKRETSVSSISTSFEKYYDSLYSSLPISLDVFSLTQRLLGKHEARDFEVLKSDNGELFLHGDEKEINEGDLRIIANQCEMLYKETSEYGGHFLYVQVPYKNVGMAPELKDYSGDNTEQSESFLDDLVREKGVPVLDLRNYDECKEYYNTDHHWTVKSAFNASRIISDEVERIYGIDLEDHKFYGDISNYDIVTYDNSFLGSIGIKVGRFFAGKDDFSIYKPKFDSDFTFVHKDKKKPFEYYGDFWETFVDQELLENSSYNNKYDANMHGAYVESIINNNLSQNDYRGLLITHSYGRAMAQYMCFNYKELRYLDPQKDRYNENLIDYIRNYKPDIVIYMYDRIVNIGDGYWKE